MTTCNHLWRSIDSTRAQCAKCGEIQSSAPPAGSTLPGLTEDEQKDFRLLGMKPLGQCSLDDWERYMELSQKALDGLIEQVKLRTRIDS